MTFYEQIPGNYYNISCLHISNRTQLYFLKTDGKDKEQT